VIPPTPGLWWQADLVNFMDKFVLKAPFKPTGDQPQAIKQLVAGLKSGARDQTLLGVTGSGKTFTMANVIQQIQRPTLIISHNKTLAAQLAAEFQEFFPDNAVHYFVSYYDYYLPESYTPQTDTYIEKETSINEEIDRLRHAATQSLLTRKDVIIVASVSCIFGLGNPVEYEKISLKLNISDKKLQRKEILKKLLDMRYERNDIDLHRGTFRVRGSVLDVFPSFALDEIYRVTFKGDIIDKLEVLDQLTHKPKLTNDPTNQLTIFPATHYVAPFDNLDEVLKQVERDKVAQVKKFEKENKLIEAQRLNQRVDFDIEMIRQTGYCNGIENYSKYFDGRDTGVPPYTLLDFFPRQSASKASGAIRVNPRSRFSDWLMFIDESHMTVPQIRGMYAGDRSRKETLINYGFRLQAAFDNRPLNFAEFRQKMPQTVYVSATPGSYELEKSTNKNIVQQLIRPTGLLDPRIAIRPTKHQIDDILEEVGARIKQHQRVLITTLTKRMAEDLAEYLQETNIKAYHLHSEINTLERLEILRDLRSGIYDVIVGINLLREGLDLPEVSLILILDADKEGFLRSDTALIQTMGRAARHSDGRVIMYADKITGSMQRAIDEVRRRRKIQEVHNKKNKITPKSIKKEIKAGILGLVHHEAESILEDLPKNLKTIPQEELQHIIKDLDNQMEIAAANLEFETAAMLRDQIKALQENLKEKKTKKASKRGDQFAGLKALKR
jgi:excinuclease ABC subunit B